MSATSRRDGFQRSFALVDAQGRLLAWDAGFEDEFAAAKTPIARGVLLSSLAEAASIRHDEAGPACELARTYRHGARVVSVVTSPAPGGGWFRLAEAVRDAAGGVLYEQAGVRWCVDGDPTAIATHEIRLEPDGGRHYSLAGEDMRSLWGLSADFDMSDMSALMERLVQTPEDLERVQAYFDEMTINLFPHWLDVPVRDADERLRWIRMAFTPRRDADGCIRIVNRMRDVTRERLANDQLELLRSAVEHATDGIHLLKITPEGNYATVYVNRALEALSGWPAAELMGASFAPRGGWEGGYWGPAMSDAETSDPRGVEFEAVRRDGRPVWVEASAKIVQRREDGSVDWVVVCRNIDERRRAQRELLEAKESAETASQVKSEFLANMSHEIRTPMNGVLGMIGLLLATDLDPKQTRYAQAAEQSGEALMGLLNAILDVSKLEAGKLELEAIDFELTTVAEDAVGLLEGQAKAKGVRLGVRIDGAARLALCGDPNRLRQIILNLVGNGLKFTAEGGVTLSVTRLDRGRGGHGRARLRFAVTDTGIGMDEQVRARLFQTFSQADSSITRRYGGTGLGLAISKQLVDLMEGEIGVASAPGKGSTFWFEIPFALASGAGAQRGAQAAQAEAAARPLRVLLAEDHAINQQFALAVLEAGGHRADLAVNGFEAIEAVKRSCYDVVLMDVQMPGCGGVEATQAIRALPPPKCDVRIIALTADAMSGSKDLYVEAGMDDYLSKPIRPADLLAKLAQIAAQRDPAGAVRPRAREATLGSRGPRAL